jgi:hypothetical protein
LRLAFPVKDASRKLFGMLVFGRLFVYKKSSSRFFFFFFHKVVEKSLKESNLAVEAAAAAFHKKLGFKIGQKHFTAPNFDSAF